MRSTIVLLLFVALVSGVARSAKPERTTTTTTPEPSDQSTTTSTTANPSTTKPAPITTRGPGGGHKRPTGHASSTEKPEAQEPYEKAPFVEAVKESMGVALSHMLAGMESFVKGYDKIKATFDWRELPISKQVEEVLTQRFCPLLGLDCIANTDWWRPKLPWADLLEGLSQLGPLDGDEQAEEEDYY